jgi:outer membrane protein TolC
VATLYFDLIQAEASLELFRETEAEAREVARLTTAYAATGQGTKADADRAGTTSLLFRRQVQRGEEEVAVASTRLARRLHLDPVVRMRSIVARIEPITLIDVHTSVQELIDVALHHRPEIGARSAAVNVATTRYRQEKLRPALPTLWIGFSGGAFGGGSNLITPLLGNFGSRTDFDVRAYWTLQNMGFGNMSLWRQRQAAVGVALGEQSRTINQVRREVSAALAQAIAARGQIGVTERQLATSVAGFREDLDRIRGTISRPIEMVNSLDLLAEARQNHRRQDDPLR